MEREELFTRKHRYRHEKRETQIPRKRRFKVEGHRRSKYSRGNSRNYEDDFSEIESDQLRHGRCDRSRAAGPSRKEVPVDLDDMVDSYDVLESQLDPRRCSSPRNSFGNVELLRNTTYYRCNLQVAVKELGSVTLEECHIAILKRTPLWYPFQALYSIAQNYPLSRFSKDEGVIREIISRLDVDSGQFHIGKKRMRLEKTDVQLILGVYGGSITKSTAPSKEEYPPWLVRCFPSEIRRAKLTGKKLLLYKKDYLEKMEELIAEGNPDRQEDVVRLAIFYLLASFLSPMQNGSVPVHMYDFVEVLEDIKKYDWAAIILEILNKQLMSTTTMKVGGCAMLLLYWFCEHTLLLKPAEPNAFPRMLKWDLMKVYEALDRYKLRKFPIDLVEESQLVPTKAEIKALKLLKIELVKERILDPLEEAGAPITSARGDSPCRAELGQGGCSNAQGDPVRRDGDLLRNFLAPSPEPTPAEPDGGVQSDIPVSPARDLGSSLVGGSPVNVPPSPVVNPSCSPACLSPVGAAPVNSTQGEIFRDNDVVNETPLGEQALFERDGPSFSLGMGFGKTQVNCNVDSELARALALVDELKQKIENQRTENTVALTAVIEKNQVLMQKVVELEGGQERLTEALKCSGEALAALEHKYDDVVCMNKAGEWAMGHMRTDNIADRAVMQKELSCSEAKVMELQAENARVTSRLDELMNPTMTQMLNDPATLRYIDTTTELLTVSAEKKKLEAEKQKYEAMLVEQRAEIDKLKNKSSLEGEDVGHLDLLLDLVTHENPQQATPVRGGANPAGGGSISRAVKARNDRVKISYSPQLNTNELVAYNEGLHPARRTSPRRLVMGGQQPCPLDDSKLAVSLLTPEIRRRLDQAWKQGGVSIVVHGGSPFVAKITFGMILSILNYEGLVPYLLDAWGEMLLVVYREKKTSKTTMIFSAECFCLISNFSTTSSASLRAMVDDRIEEAMRMEVLLFPLLTSGNSEQTNVCGGHCTLLKYNPRTNEWRFYNSIARKDSSGTDSHYNMAQLVVNYVHARMCDNLKLQGKSNHALLTRGMRTLIEVDCPQIPPNSPDSAIVVCSLMETNVVRYHRKVQTFTNRMAADYRAKMCSWIVSHGNVMPTF